MTVFGKTDIGKRRSDNQDYFDISELSENCRLITVCDGMGGAAGGSTASRLAAETVVSSVKSGYHENMNLRAVKNLLNCAVSAANITVFDRAMQDSSLAGMGTTAVIALIIDSSVYISHVGDSRAYIINDGITQITTDHSIVQLMVESGQITPQEALVHPKRNIITRAIGVADSVEAEFDLIELQSGDKLLICTDGLSNFVSDPELFEIASGSDVNSAVEKLVDLANDNGGGDNITLVIAQND